MEAATLVEVLDMRGVRLWIEGDMLKFAPASVLTPEEVGELRHHKAALLALLRPTPPPEFPCPSCGCLHWWRGATSWVCSACHPPAADVVPLEVVALARDLRSGWQGAVREIAETLGWPQVKPQPHFSVGPGSIPWERFVRTASVPDLVRASEALRGLLAKTAGV